MTNRTHLVLIPGFGGFDGLGQLHYYEGVVPRYDELVRRKEQGFDRMLLHFFDNLPAAAVKTRALLLWEFLVKRVERRELVPHDSLVLLGHSTGALDLRMLVHLMLPAHRGEIHAEFPSRSRASIDESCVFLTGALARAVFLSAPHRGTGLATSLSGRPSIATGIAARGLHLAVRGLRFGLVRSASQVALGAAYRVTRSQVLSAAREAVSEAHPRRDQTDFDRAEARAAYSDLYLWTRNLAGDRKALRDLSVGGFEVPLPTGADEDSPWTNIETLSILTRADEPSSQSDRLYRKAYGLTAAGSYGDPGGFTVRRFGSDEAVTLEDGAQNDGIVNTRSMHWPLAACQRLVRADHADVIGHFDKRPGRERAGGREHRAFDLLGSKTPFTVEQFDALWDGVLRFCATGTTYGV